MAEQKSVGILLKEKPALQASSDKDNKNPWECKALKGDIVVDIPHKDRIPNPDHPSHNYRLYSEPDVTLYATPIDFGVLNGNEVNYLLAVQPPGARVMEYLKQDKMKEKMEIKKGDLVIFRYSFKKDAPFSFVHGKVQYIGFVRDSEGIYFGIEILDDKYRGKGTTNGRPHFTCGANNGVFVSIDKILQKSVKDEQHLPNRPAANTRQSQKEKESSSSYLQKAKGVVSNFTNKFAGNDPLMAKGESLPNVQYQYKAGDRVVIHSVHDLPIEGTVRWTGHVKVNTKISMPVVGVETVKKINVDRDLPDIHLKVTDGHGHELFKVALDHSRVFVPEQLVVRDYEYLEQKKKDNETQNEQKLAKEYGLTVEEYRTQKELLDQADKDRDDKHDQRFNQPFIPPDPPTLEEEGTENYSSLPSIVNDRQPSVLVSSSPLNIEDQFAIGSMVVIPTQGGSDPLKGVVKWIGTLPEIQGLIAGVELDTEYPNCTDGTWKGRRFFKCPNGRGYFCPLKSLQQDVAFIDKGQVASPNKDKALLDQAREEKLTLEREKQKLKEENELLVRESTIIKEEREEETRKLNDKCLENENLTREKKAFQVEIQMLKEELERVKQRSKYEKDELLQVNRQLREENERIQAQYEHEKNNCNQLQSHIARFSIENMRLKGQVKRLEDDNTANDINYWEISYKQVKTNQEVLGRGGWGQVLVGLFQGQKFALKMLHSEIVSPYYNQLVRREISMMAKVRHPNLILFVGAILDHPSGSPIIMTELLDTSLRKAYKDGLLRDDGVKLCILRDVGAALNYLHCHKDSIIHRDVSSANVLLESKGNGKWKGKLSDFGSANLMQYATTAGPGAQVYAAPEVPQVQTTKMDVYSYGILMCEVMTCQFPFPQSFPDMVMSLGSKWSPLHQLVVACTKELPDDRPHIDYTLQSLYTHYNDLLLMEITQFNNYI